MGTGLSARYTLGTDLHTGNAVHGLGQYYRVCSKFRPQTPPARQRRWNAAGWKARLITKRHRSLGRLGIPELIDHTELGHLSVGAIADVAVFQMLKGAFAFRDCGGGTVSSDQKLQCMLTLQGGNIAFDGNAITGFRWQDGPPSYWVCP